jgi:hypothetical protein
MMPEPITAISSNAVPMNSDSALRTSTLSASPSRACSMMTGARPCA